MIYKYETHLHTTEASACSVSNAKSYIEPYVKAGYKGIIVTDHFFGGNTAIDRTLDWKTRINLFCKGYENALEEAKKYEGFQVFFGFEQTFQGDDYLVYGLDKEWLLNHPEVETMNHEELFAAVNYNHGLIVQAHPFRLRHYIKAIHVHPRTIHAIETYNGGNVKCENELATLYAKLYNFPKTSGSDIHNSANVPTNGEESMLGGVSFDTPLTSIDDYINRIKNHEGKIIDPSNI